MLKEEFRLAMALTGETSTFPLGKTTSVLRFLIAVICPGQDAVVTYRREMKMFAI